MSQHHTRDVAIVGGGLSGSLAAAILGRAGYRVTLIDRYDVYPRQFRVEKITGNQVNLLQQLGMEDAVAPASVRFDRVLGAHRGRIIEDIRGPNYGILYEDFVRAVRAAIPPAVKFHISRVDNVQTGAEQQSITLASGETVTARLLILATGMSDSLRQELGITRRTLVKRQSLSFGFSVAPRAGTDFAFPALTYYGDRWGDAISYLTLFPVPGRMRANLFTFIDLCHPWTRQLRQNPKPALLAAMPGLERFLGDFHVIDDVQSWSMDLSAVEGHQVDGVVLIGDAFQTSCPVVGTGVSRLLVDVDRLCNVHMPRWLATPGMGVEKITEFYDDPVKKGMDHFALHWGRYRRALTLDRGFNWTLRRLLFYPRRQLISWIDRTSPGWGSRLRSFWSGGQWAVGKPVSRAGRGND